MANICLYKIKVKGTKAACYALVNMIPLYSWEKEYISEDGTDDEFTLVFSGACKWSIDAYTVRQVGIVPYTSKEIFNIEDGDGWDIPLIDKSLLLCCEIFCNSKDIDSSSYAKYEHYNNGVEICDECPKELHIKRGRDYDFDFVGPGTVTEKEKTVNMCKVKFDSGTYWYVGKYNVNDIVKVEGTKSGQLGRVIDVGMVVENNGLYKIIEHIGHVTPLDVSFFENIWDSYKPKDRKEYLKSIGINETITKKKFISILESRWILFALDNENDWESFTKTFVR